MVSTSRDRVTLDLRGIGPAVRAAAAARQVPVATFCRDAIVEAAGSPIASSLPAFGSMDRSQSTKLTLRLSQPDAELLILRAVAHGLSYGSFVARLVRGAPLPAPAADRAADRVALVASVDRLTDLVADISAMVRMVRASDAEGAARKRANAMSLVEDVQRHLELASKVLARNGGDP